MEQAERLAVIDRRLDTLTTVAILGVVAVAVVGVLVGLMAFGIVDVTVKLAGIGDSNIGSDIP